MDELRINAVLSLFMSACLVPLATVFYTLYWAGRILTRPEKRTDLGNWLGRFCAAVGVFMTAVMVLTLNRWVDFNPDTDRFAIATVSRIIGVVALVVALVCAHRVVPLILQRIREGKI